MDSAATFVSAWRSAFSTLRDEILSSPLHASIPKLLQHHIFSQSHSLIAAVPDLPLHEVTSDAIFLMQLVDITAEGAEDLTQTVANICHLIHEVCQRVTLEINSDSWNLMLGSSEKIVDFFLGNSGANRASLVNRAGIRAIKQCLDAVRVLIHDHLRKCLQIENIQSVKFLLSVVAYCHTGLNSSSSSCGNQRVSLDPGKPIYGNSSLLDIQTTVFNMIGEVLPKVGSSLPVEIWQSVIEILRKVMDALASRGQLLEIYAMSTFYTSILHCLHLVLTNPKDSFLDHVPGFVAALRMFLVYGLNNKSQPVCPLAGHKEKKLDSMTNECSLDESSRTVCGLYRPPHLRKKENTNMQSSRCSSDHSSSIVDFASDSEHSDSDGSVKDADYIRSSKARIAAINCIQDLCQADPLSFSAQWTMLLPTSNVFQLRKYEATLMTCLLFDPSLQARIASASTLVSMLDGPSSVLLQVAEFKESAKCGSFTALSSSLGQILMQLHTGILHLIKCETHGRLLTFLFKILMLLMKSTPYARMPKVLLPTVITSLHGRIEDGFPLKNDPTALMALAFSCLTVAVSISPASLDVNELFLKETSNSGFAETQEHQSLLLTTFQYSERISNPTISFEALQALKAISHNYPNTMVACWGQISTVVYGLLRQCNPEVFTNSLKGQGGNSIGSMYEKVIAAAVKVLDECLRAISGFKGTEDVSDDRSLETPFTSDCIRTKKISSAPLHGPENVNNVEGKPIACCPGSQQWSEVMEKHLPLAFSHHSAMVRAASVTCLAGITSSVFFSLATEKQDLIISFLISASVDESPSVRSAACRAIGVIACFPQVSQSAERLNTFSCAAEFNTHDPSVLVRTTASWALANICDSLRHCANSKLVAILAECALRLTKDVDKVKANAVRALGNLSRYIQYRGGCSAYKEPLKWPGLSSTTNCPEMLPLTGELKINQKFLSSSCHPTIEDLNLLDRVMQAFLSCVTTGNVKVQWNVCHALSNLFLNETLKLQDLEWAPSLFSVLLLLLRDSSNFKIRIQAAAALAVPSSLLDFGRSYSDIVQGLQHIIENLTTDQISVPSNFKYMVMLEKQLTATMLHVLGLASGTEHQALKDFLVKKALFFEEWFNMLLSPLGDNAGTEPDGETNHLKNQKKLMIYRAIQSLTQVYEVKNQHATAQKFKNLIR